MIKRDDASGEYLGIQCDEPGCETMSPPAAEVLAGHGLNNMGWHCSGGTHICPVHAPEKPDKPTPERFERRDTRFLP